VAIDKRNLAWLVDIRFLAFLAGLITFLVYIPALENGFVSWDDDTYLYKNDYIRHLNGEFFSWAFTEFRASNWHPLTWLSHAIGCFDHGVVIWLTSAACRIGRLGL
jgi:hypothetical protein